MAKAKKKPIKGATTRAKKTAKAPKNQPLMAMKPSRTKIRDTAASRARRARIHAITARTRAGQQAIDALIADADTSDLDHLRVMTKSGPRRAKGSWRNSPDRLAEPEGGDDIPRPAVNKDIYLPKTTRTCPTCKRTDHPGMSCKDLGAWLLTARRVLAGEIASPDEWPRFEVGEVYDLAPAPTGRGRGRPPTFTPADEAQYIRTATAADSSREPSPSP
jgi:hypothetical protein